MSDEICFQGELDEMLWMRRELINWNKQDYWFFVTKESISVANDMGGALSVEKLSRIKKECLELSRKFRNGL